jgi:thiamine biosynthesis lipoprotein
MARWRSLQFDFSAMASPCSVQIDGQDERAMRRAAAQAMAEVKRVEQKFSRYREGSVVSRINRAAGLGWVEIDPETQSLLDFSAQLWAQSDGLFDVTSGVLRHAWDFKAGGLPSQDRLAHCLSLVGWPRVQRQGRRVRLEAGMELDFGGFGKEYAADRAAAVLQQHGVSHALVNLGGDLHAVGPRGLPGIQGQPWRISVQHPRPGCASAQTPLLQVELAQGGLATSGDYERFFIHNGQRYCHVLNPRTGWPVAHWQSVSVRSANATTAGALSTIAMLKGAPAADWLATQSAWFAAVSPTGDLLTGGPSAQRGTQ